MKCPRCGSEMVLDSHRKIPLNMCYECGFIEGRTLEDEPSAISNYVHLKNSILVIEIHTGIYIYMYTNTHAHTHFKKGRQEVITPFPG